MKAWHYGGAAVLCIVGLAALALLGGRRSPRPRGREGGLAAGLKEIRSIPELIDRLTVRDGRREIEGEYHRIKPDVEKRLWGIVSRLPVAQGGDKLLIDAIEQVYTKYHENYLHGYVWHYPYLDSRKAIALAEKLEREYPDSPYIPRALFLSLRLSGSSTPRGGGDPRSL